MRPEPTRQTLTTRWRISWSKNYRRRVATAQDRAGVVVCPWKTFGARSWRTPMKPKPMATRITALDTTRNTRRAEVVVAPEVPRRSARGCPRTRRRGKRIFAATRLVCGNSGLMVQSSRLARLPPRGNLAHLARPGYRHVHPVGSETTPRSHTPRDRPTRTLKPSWPPKVKMNRWWTMANRRSPVGLLGYPVAMHPARHSTRRSRAHWCPGSSKALA